MLKTLLKNEIETINFGESFAKNLKPGSLILLKGELGAGKTCFCRGVAKGLLINTTILSPTFNILHIYNQKSYKLPLIHLDFYNVKNIEQLEDLGIYDLICEQNSVCLIEWWDLFPDIFYNLNTIKIDIEKHQDGRLIIIRED